MNRTIIQILSVSLFVATLLWGAWTLLYYLGVPVHGAVLIPQDILKSLDGMCGSASFVCRGAYGLFGSVWHSLTRVSFLVTYAVICAAMYAAVLAWRYVRTLRINGTLTFRPWHILALFMFALWLIFTILGFSKNGDMPFRRIIEPVAQVYQGAGPQAIAGLRTNYDLLKERGCLRRIGTFSGVAEASEIKTHCLQAAFFTRVLPPVLFILILLFEFLVLGRFLLRKVLRMATAGGLEEAVLSAGAGACGFIAILWTLAVAHMFVAPVGWALVIAVPAVLHKESRHWFRVFLRSEWSITVPWWSPVLILGWFLLSYLALNFLNVVRPFPIGWDDLGSYLNRPRQLVSYGHFIFSMSAFQWEYLTALGFLLFGFEHTFGATASLFINWTQGLLALLSVMLITRTFLGRGGVLAATLYYTLPMVGHFSFADMKIDNAVFAIGALAAFALWRGLFPRDEEEQTPSAQRKWVLLSGIFVGFAFGMKVTSIMMFMALASVLAGVALHPLGFVSAVIAACSLFVQQGTLNVSAILERVGYDPALVSPMTVAVFGVAISSLFFAGACFLGKPHIRRFFILCSMFLAGFAGAVFPWIEHNNLRNGRVIPGMVFSAPNNIAPFLDPFGTVKDADYSLPPELRVDQKDATCTATGAAEELGRYWGTRKGWEHYLTLPFRNVMNLDSAGYYVTTMPALLLFPLLLLLPYFWKKEGRWLRWMWLFTTFLIVQWTFLANGIAWYGIGMFLGLVVGLEVLFARAPDAFNRSVAGVFIVLSLVFCLGQRLWQFESQRNLFEYPLGKVTAEALRERTIPYYDDITEMALERAKTMPDRPLLYRVGTFMPYFIPRNFEVIGISDHQLDFFNCVYQGRDPKIMLARLRALGFNSIVFDTNTATIERDINGSLHKKVQMFADFINDASLGLKVVINDTGAGISYILIP